MDLQSKKWKEWSLFLLRIFIAGVFFRYGIPKLLDFSGTSQYMVSQGLPSFFGPIVAVFEITVAILLLIGLWNKWTNTAVALFLVGATFFGVIPEYLSADFQRNLIMIAANLVLISHGPGKWSMES